MSGEMRGRMDYRKFYAKPLQLGDVMAGEMAGLLESANRISPRALFGVNPLPTICAAR